MSSSIVICMPAGESTKSHTAVCLARLCGYMAASGVPGDVFGVQVSDIPLARNKLVADALESGATHIGWIDSDMTFPREGMNRLLEHDKDIVGCFYPSRFPPHRMVGALEGATDIGVGGLQKADYLPGGFILVRTDVYRSLKEPWYREEYRADGFCSEDVIFTREDAKDAGYETWVDLDLSQEIGHIGNTILSLSVSRKKDCFSISDMAAINKVRFKLGENGEVSFDEDTVKDAAKQIGSTPSAVRLAVREFQSRVAVFSG